MNDQHLHPHRQRLAALRAALTERGLDGFVVPRTDAHQNEYLPADAERMAWLTGFTGSAGLTIVLRERAALFTDGRYTVQARHEVDGSLYELPDTTATSGWAPGDWLEDAMPRAGRLGYDPWLHTRDDLNRLREVCKGLGAELSAVESNPVDALWTDRPPPPLAPIIPHPENFAGLSSAAKRKDTANQLAAAGEDAAVLTAPDSIAWLLNIRGSDIPFTPYPLCYALLHASGAVDLFAPEQKIARGLAEHLGDGVRLAGAEDFEPALLALAGEGKRVRVDPLLTPSRITDILKSRGARLSFQVDPCQRPKAIKNSAERAGTRAAHRRDGAALSRFLCWLDGAAADGGLDEMAAAEQLSRFRAEDNLYRGDSFPTISGAGPHGAIVHYRVTADSNRRLEPGQLFLLDSGGQYLDGTTDVTRTVLIGEARDEDALAFQRQCFTRVLQGHIALARVRFPKGTTGSQLDSLARRPLWEIGLDYNHGTGHGVGSYLSVHEGPQRISKMPSRVALEPGMVLSNEPGFYLEEQFGIRIENLQMVVEGETHPAFGVPFLGFETLTLSPIDTRLVDPSLLSADEKDWLNAYHARVRTELTPLVDENTAEWLSRGTREI